MANLNNVNFTRTEGGLGRALPNNDHISGMIFFYDTIADLPGFAADDRIKLVNSLQEAVDLGIVNTHVNETKATGGTLTINGAASAAGEACDILIDGAKITGGYTTVAGDTAVNTLAANLTSAINALTSEHGYSAVNTGAPSAVITLTAPSKLGIAGNVTPSITADNATASPIVAFTSGVGDFVAVMYYHISEYFRMQPEGELYVAVYAESEGTTYTGSRIQTIQDYAEGAIRQIAVFNQKVTYAAGQISASQTYATTNETNFKPLSVIQHNDMTGLYLTTNLNTIDVSAQSSKNVSIIASEDGNWHQLAYSDSKKYIIGDKVIYNGKSFSCKKSSTGNSPYDTSYWTQIGINLNAVTGYTISTLGNVLGVMSAASVEQDIAEVESFRLDSGTNLDTPSFCIANTAADSSILYKDISVSLRNALNTKHYIFTRNFTGLTGTFYNDSWTAISATSDYATIENNRVIDKATRQIRTLLLPKVASRLYLNSDGTMTEDTVAVFKNKAVQALEAMERDGEISSFSVTINPDQDVLTTSQVLVSVLIVPVGIARDIQVNIGFTTSLT